MIPVSVEFELFQALMTAIKRLEEVGGKTDDLRDIANRTADPYEGRQEVGWGDV